MAQNRARLPLGAVETLPCDWQWFSDGADGGGRDEAEPIAIARAALRDSQFDLVLGSDLVYSEEGMRALVRVFAALAARRSSCSASNSRASRAIQSSYIAALPLSPALFLPR